MLWKSLNVSLLGISHRLFVKHICLVTPQYEREGDIERERERKKKREKSKRKY